MNIDLITLNRNRLCSDVVSCNLQVIQSNDIPGSVAFCRGPNLLFVLLIILLAPYIRYQVVWFIRNAQYRHRRYPEIRIKHFALLGSYLLSEIQATLTQSTTTHVAAYSGKWYRPESLCLYPSAQLPPPPHPCHSLTHPWVSGFGATMASWAQQQTSFLPFFSFSLFLTP